MGLFVIEFAGWLGVLAYVCVGVVLACLVAWLVRQAHARGVRAGTEETENRLQGAEYSERRLRLSRKIAVTRHALNESELALAKLDSSKAALSKAVTSLSAEWDDLSRLVSDEDWLAIDGVKDIAVIDEIDQYLVASDADDDTVRVAETSGPAA